MSEDKIKKYELDLLLSAINRIVLSEVLENALSDQLPLTDDLPDSNIIYHGKASMLFVDIRKSTKLPERFNDAQLVKIYRSYIRVIVQAIRYSGGVVRDFMGDGVLAVFVDNEDGKSEDKAVRASRYITTAIDKMLNPVLNEEIKYRISCGIGVHTGEISLSKVGMKGKKQQEDSDNEYGIAWIGSSTNLACKFSGAVDNGTIFISTSTYSALSDIDDKQKWEKIEISKNGNVLKGYIAKQYYLPLDIDTDIEACTAGKSVEGLSLAEELKMEYRWQLADIEKKAEELGKKEKSLQDKEHRLNCKASEINQRGKNIFFREQAINKQEYQFYCHVLGSGHCKETFVKEMGTEFWDNNLNKALLAGSKIGKGEHEVKQEVSYAMVSIYEDLELFDKAYDFLVEQAAGYPWLHLPTVQRIVNKVGYCDRLKTALYIRLGKNDLSTENRNVFEQIKHWLVFEYMP